MTPIIIQCLPITAAIFIVPTLLTLLIPATKKEATKLMLRRPIVKTFIPILPGKER